MELKNFMEDVVLAKMDQVLDQYPDCCRCEQCRLTRVQAMSFEYEVEVIQQIAKAIETVSAHPRHPKRE